jgi:hypothetical protein
MDLYAKMRQTADVKEVNWSNVAVATFEATLVEKSVVGHRMSENRELQESAPNESAAVCNMGLKDE